MGSAPASRGTGLSIKEIARGVRRRNEGPKPGRFSNFDPEMVRLFVEFLSHVERQRQIEQFWLETRGLPEKKSLCKSIVNVYSTHNKRSGVT